MNVKAIEVQNLVRAMVTIPRIIYVVLLAAALGGPLMTGCSNDPETSPGDTVKQAPSQEIMTNMLQKMGIISVTSTTKASSVVKGDLIEFGYNDVPIDSKIALKIDEDESSSGKMVYYGIITDTYTGYGKSIRYSVSASSDNTLLVDKEAKTNGFYSLKETDEYKLNSDNTITQSKLESDGSKTAMFKYAPKDSSSLYRTNLITGKIEVIDSILVIQK